MTTTISTDHTTLDGDPVIVVTATSDDKEGRMILREYEGGYIEGADYNQSETRWELRSTAGRSTTIAWGLTLEALAREAQGACFKTVDDAAEALRRDIEGEFYLGYARPRRAFTS